MKFGKVAKSIVESTNTYPYIYNVEGETLVSGYYAYWYILNFGKYSGGNYITQIAMPYQDSLSDSELFIRSAHGSTWRDWRRVLHSNNYYAYALPLSGGTITGRINRSSGGAWISGRDSAIVMQTNTNPEGHSWNPVIGVKT